MGTMNCRAHGVKISSVQMVVQMEHLLVTVIHNVAFMDETDALLPCRTKTNVNATNYDGSVI
jgi:hypothetical protein